MSISVKNIAVAATAVAALGAFSAPAFSATALKTLACFQRNHDYVQSLHTAFIEPLNKAKGEVSIRYLGGPEVTPRQKAAGALQRGLVDVLFCPGAYYGGQLAEARLLGAHNISIPEVRKNGGWEMMQEAWAKGLNAHFLAWTHDKGQKFFVYTKFEPKLSKTTGIDLNGVKMRSTGLYKAFMKAMGATPVVISPGDVYSALERGVVEGVAWPWGSMASYGWEKFLKYRIEPEFFGATMTLLVNKNKWDSLSPAGRDQLTKAAAAYEAAADGLIVEKGHADDAKLKAAGITTVKLEGEYARAYLKTIYEAKWAENDAQRAKFVVDYDKLKAKMYNPGGGS